MTECSPSNDEDFVLKPTELRRDLSTTVQGLLSILVSGLMSVATAFLATGNPNLFLEIVCAVSSMSFFLLTLLSGVILNSRHVSFYLPQISGIRPKSIYLIAFGSTFFLMCAEFITVRHEQFAEMLDHVSHRMLVLAYLYLSILVASRVALPVSVRLGASVFACSKGLAYVIPFALPFVRHQTEVVLADIAALSTLILCSVILFRTVQVSQTGAAVNRHDQMLGGSPTPSAAVGSFIATLLSLSFLFGWYARGALSWGPALYIGVYLGSLVLAALAILTLRRYTRIGKTTIRTPMEALGFCHVSTWESGVILLALCLMYGTLAISEIRLLHVGLSVAFGAIWATAILAIVVSLVVFYLSVSFFWASLRTDALNLSYFLLLFACLGIVTLLVLPEDVFRAGFRDLSGYRPKDVAELQSSFFAVHLVAGIVATSASILAAPDTWSRFVLALPKSSGFGGTISVAVVLSVLLSLLLGAMLIFAFSDHEHAADWRKLTPEEMLTTIAESLPKDVRQNRQDALLLSWTVALAAGALFAFITTVDTAISSLTQAVYCFSKRSKPRHPSTYLLIAIAIVCVVGAISMRLPFNAALSFLPATAIATAPWWLTHLAASTEHNARSLKAICDGSLATSVVLLIAFVGTLVIRNPEANGFLVTNIPAHGPVYCLLLLISGTATSLLIRSIVSRFGDRSSRG